MPRFDQTGPDGEGAMTGRKNGVCTGKVKKGEETFMGFGRGRGWFGGWGGGRAGGYRARQRWFAGDQADVDNSSVTQDDIKNINEKLTELQKQLASIKKQH